MKLYHFTCDHGREGIEKMGNVFPNYHPLLEIKVAWFTDLADPDRDVVGLTSDSLTCDRMAYRFEVDPSKPRPWLGSLEQSMTPAHYQADLHRFSDPRHWWISRVSVPIISE